MSAVTQIVLPDALATPVNHTFVPLGPDAQGVWWFEDQSAVSAVGYNRVSISLVRPPIASQSSKSENRVNRVKLGIYLPALETMGNNSAGFTPAPTVAYVERVSMEFILPERATLQNRKDGRKYALSLLADVQVIAAIESLQSIY